jgi:hypothetical protein
MLMALAHRLALNGRRIKDDDGTEYKPGPAETLKMWSRFKGKWPATKAPDLRFLVKGYRTLLVQ